MSEKEINFIDLTNSEGVRGTSQSLSRLQKTMVNIYLNEVGIHGSQTAYPEFIHDRNFLTASVELVERGVLSPLELSGYWRKNNGELGKLLQDSKLNTVAIPFDLSRGREGESDSSEILNRLPEIIEDAKEGGIKYVTIVAVRASNTDPELLPEFAKVAQEGGADAFRYCDTDGRDSPVSIRKKIDRITDSAGINIEINCSDLYGMAVSNSLSGALEAVESGVQTFICTTVNGYGGRGGNCGLTEVLTALEYVEEYRERIGPHKRIDKKALWKVLKYVSEALSIPLPYRVSFLQKEVSSKYRDQIGLSEPVLDKLSGVRDTGEYLDSSTFHNIFEALGFEFESESHRKTTVELCRYAGTHNQKILTEDEYLFIAENPEQARKLLTVIP